MSNLITSYLPKHPEFELSIRNFENQIKVWDEIRRQYILLTPEEYVRQQFIQFCIQKGFPSQRIAIEKQLKGSLKRFDLVLYNQDYQPICLIECKAETVTITNEVTQQLISYNQELQCRMTLITNGSQCILTAAQKYSNWDEVFTSLKS